MIIKNLSDLRPEIIIWEDICQCDETWATASELLDWYADKADAFVEQVGFVIAEDDNNIIFTDSFIESDEMFGNVHKIPKSVIRKRVKLLEQHEEA